jgi:hypothetical protein
MPASRTRYVLIPNEAGCRLPRIRKYPCQESNLNLGVRSAALSPLSYKGEKMNTTNKESRTDRFPDGRLPVVASATSCHYKELTCENGREEPGRRDECTHATTTLNRPPRRSWLIMAFPLVSVCGTSIAGACGAGQSFF